MRPALFFLAVACALFASAAVLRLPIAAVDAADASAASATVSLTDKTFDKEIKAAPLALVKFTAPWCGHCKRMVKDFDEAAAELKGRALLADVDATAENKLKDRFKVSGFPTIKLFLNGEPVSEYSGERSKSALIGFVERQLAPPATEASSTADVHAALGAASEAAAPPAAVLGVVGRDGSGKEAFEKVARNLREVLTGARFLLTKDASVAAELAKEVGAPAATGALKEHGVLVLKPRGEVDSESERVATLPLGGKKEWAKSDAKVAEFIKQHASPLVGEISQATAPRYMEIGKPLFLMFTDTASPEPSGHELMRRLAKKHADKLSFVLADLTALSRFKDYIGLSGDAQRFAIHELTRDTNYAYTESVGAESEEDMSAFVARYLAGELKPTRKSAAPPAKNDDAVKIVVGDTWDDVVMDPSKDVLVEQYAPWCGHCKKLDPVYTELAEQLRHVPSLVVAKMDSTENDAPGEYKARGFPTIHFFPAVTSGGDGDDGKGEAEKHGIKYSGSRSKDDFVRFIKKHATHKVDDGSAAETGDGGSEQGGEEEEETGAAKDEL